MFLTKEISPQVGRKAHEPGRVGSCTSPSRPLKAVGIPLKKVHVSIKEQNLLLMGPSRNACHMHLSYSAMQLVVVNNNIFNSGKTKPDFVQFLLALSNWL
jgi:hypothetical protein